MPDKRVLIMSDTQSGCRTGLTPPKYQRQDDSKWQEIQETGWAFFCQAVDRWKPYDICLANGDMMDGEGTRSLGLERDWSEDDQIQIAADILAYTEAPKVRMTAGTFYHVKLLEKNIVPLLQLKGIDANCKYWQFLNVNGVEIAARHHVGGSSIPYGEATPLLKERMHNLRWTEMKVQKHADVIIRSHVHKYLRVLQDGVWSVTTPSLQMLGDLYGSTRCSGVVHFGILVMDISENGEIIWHDKRGREIMEAEVQMEASEII